MTSGFLRSYSGQLRWLISAFVIATAMLPAPVIAANDWGDCEQTGDLDRKINGCTRYINSGVRARRSWAFNNRGLAWSHKGEFDRAINDYNEAIRLAPKDTAAYLNRGVAFHAKGEFDRAISDYSEAIRLDPKSAIAHNNRGSVFKDKGDLDRAFSDYNEAIRLDPKDAGAFCNRGMTKLRNKDASGNADIAKARQLDVSICR